MADKVEAREQTTQTLEKIYKDEDCNSYEAQGKRVSQFIARVWLEAYNARVWLETYNSEADASVCGFG